MTKFDNVQISHRKSRQATTYTTAELRKNMEIFKRTGVHPELASRAENAAAEKPDLPEADAERPHVFMDLAVGSSPLKPLGTLVIEVFQDVAPAAAREFTLRITGGGAGRAGFVAYERTLIHKIVDGVRLEGGRPGPGTSGAKGGGANNRGGGQQGWGLYGVPVEECRRLCHCCAGVVSLSQTTSEFTITAGPAHHLDGKQQVVGRVVRGIEHVEKLSEAEVDDVDFTPIERVTVTACGMTTAGGVDAPGGALQVAAELRAARAAAEAERAARERGETKEETKARLARESHELGASLKRSLADGMKKKQESSESSQKKVKTATGGGMMAAMLGDIPSDDDDDSSDDEE